MSSYDFRLTDKPVLEDNPELATIPELAKLTDKQLRYIFFVDWYKSPYRFLPIEDRKYKAVLRAGYKLESDGKRLDMNARNMVDGKVQNVEIGRAAFKGLQYDIEREVKETLDLQIGEILRFMRSPGKSVAELDKVVKWTSNLGSILENRKKIIEILNLRDGESVLDVEEVEDESLDSLSILEQFNEEL